ncbi:MAG: sel1 repeat family protein [Calditrichaeota bacterium]|nr:sel1 repeat family protein [Calditrichota bacterium]
MKNESVELKQTIEFINYLIKENNPERADQFKKLIRENWEKAEHGDADANYLIGETFSVLKEFIEDGKNRSELLVKIWNYYQYASEKGHAKSLFRLGQMIEVGEVVNCEVIEAIEYWKKASDKGDEEASYKLGVCYYNGTYGLCQDAAKAKIYFIRAIEEGHEKAKDFIDKLNNNSV